MATYEFICEGCKREQGRMYLPRGLLCSPCRRAKRRAEHARRIAELEWAYRGLAAIARQQVLQRQARERMAGK